MARSPDAVQPFRCVSNDLLMASVSSKNLPSLQAGSFSGNVLPYRLIHSMPFAGDDCKQKTGGGNRSPCLAVGKNKPRCT
jgi:hypothetical protein